MKTIQGPVATLFLLLALAGCREAAPEPVELPPAEVFTWTTGQPVSFSPPPEGWNRSRYQNGGAEGADFVLAGSKGEQIYVAERFFLGRRDRCAKIEEMLENLEDYDRAGFLRTIGEARLYAREPYNLHEERTNGVVNYTLQRATEAFSRHDMTTTRAELERALDQAATIRFSVEDTVDEVRFTRERNPVYPALQVDEPVAGDIAGEPALIVKFTFRGHGTPMVGRRVYTVKNNRMFEFGFQGLQENLALFERILDSVTFPPGTCEH
jgi:hypothetical protein